MQRKAATQRTWVWKPSKASGQTLVLSDYATSILHHDATTTSPQDSLAENLASSSPAGLLYDRSSSSTHGCFESTPSSLLLDIDTANLASESSFQLPANFFDQILAPQVYIQVGAEPDAK